MLKAGISNSEFYVEKYKNVSLDPKEWIRKADHLFETATLLEPYMNKEWLKIKEGKTFNYHYFSIYYMLSSYAIENLLKALIIKKSDVIKKYINEKGNLPKILLEHNLLKLTEEAKLKDLIEEEKEIPFLGKLSENAIWNGRYPVPINPQGYKKLENFFSSSDCKWIKDIIEKIKLELEK